MMQDGRVYNYCLFSSTCSLHPTGRCPYSVDDQCPQFRIDKERELADTQEVVATKERKKKAASGTDGKPRTTEDAEQMAVIEFCNLHHINAVHIPNERKCSMWYGDRMKKMGVQKGFPDLFFPYPRGGVHGLFIEMKRDEKSKLREEQQQWLNFLNRQGYMAVGCFGADHAIKCLKNYFNL